MLYKFKSKATGDLIMLQPQGQQLLEIIGKARASEARAPGILLPQDMAQALAALDAALAQEAAQPQPVEPAQAEHQTAPVSLRQRVRPFQDMLRRCMQAQEAIVWDV